MCFIFVLMGFGLLSVIIFPSEIFLLCFLWLIFIIQRFGVLWTVID